MGLTPLVRFQVPSLGTLTYLELLSFIHKLHSTATSLCCLVIIQILSGLKNKELILSDLVIVFILLHTIINLQLHCDWGNLIIKVLSISIGRCLLAQAMLLFLEHHFNCLLSKGVSMV